MFFVAVATFVFFQHKNMFARFGELARFILPEKWLSHFLGSASAMDDAVVRAYRGGDAFWRANFWRVAGWVAGTGEVRLVTQCVGHPVGMIDAFILESLSSGARAAGFVVPGALGVLEGGMVLLGAVLGRLPAEIALAISLTKRVPRVGSGTARPFCLVLEIEGHLFASPERRDEKR